MNIIETNLNLGEMSYGNNPQEIIVHHAESSHCSIEDINSWHKENGWAGVGYHYFVRKDGSIYKGRPDNAIGAHCQGSNTNTLGVCFEGSYNTETMPEIQLEAGRELIAYLKDKYGISCVSRHKDHMSTDCPGNNFPWNELISGGSYNPEVTVSSTQNNSDNWVSRLQEECNVQGFSNQVVDGIPGPNTLNGCPTMRQGAQGNITRLLQEKLVSLGFDTNGVDGIFGSGTDYAVRAFQGRCGLIADGIVGPNTWTKLLGL